LRIAPRIMAISELNYGYHYCPIPLDATQHEFERNHFFIQSVLDFFGQKNILLPQKTILNELKYLKKNLNTITLFLGASDKTRCWAAQHWADLITQLALVHPFTFVLLGGKSELETATQIIEKINLKTNSDIIVQNIINQTTLPDLAARIAQSQLLVSNDSGAAHIAVAVETPCICVSNGNHFGRFVPYPTHLATHFKVILPPLLQGIDAAILNKKFSNSSDVDIQTIEPMEVTSAVLNYLNLNVSDKNA
jgi:ADP-heptose:LPS heptosyltransferase